MHEWRSKQSHASGPCMFHGVNVLERRQILVLPAGASGRRQGRCSGWDSDSESGDERNVALRLEPQDCEQLFPPPLSSRPSEVVRALEENLWRVALTSVPRRLQCQNPKGVPFMRDKWSCQQAVCSCLPQFQPFQDQSDAWFQSTVRTMFAISCLRWI